MTVVKLDSRGRLTLGKLIAKNSIAPSEHWSVRFGPDQTLILTPVVLTERRLVE